MYSLSDSQMLLYVYGADVLRNNRSATLWSGSKDIFDEWTDNGITAIYCFELFSWVFPFTSESQTVWNSENTSKNNRSLYRRWDEEGNGVRLFPHFTTHASTGHQMCPKHFDYLMYSHTCLIRLTRCGSLEEGKAKRTRKRLLFNYREFSNHKTLSTDHLNFLFQALKENLYKITNTNLN